MVKVLKNNNTQNNTQNNNTENNTEQHTVQHRTTHRTTTQNTQLQNNEASLILALYSVLVSGKVKKNPT